MIKFFLHAYSETTASARRDSKHERREITSRIKSASWRYSTTQPYEQATIKTTIRIDELDIFGLGTPLKYSHVPALHCSGWLEITDNNQRVWFGTLSSLKTGLQVGSRGERVSNGVEFSAVSWVMLMAKPYRLTSNNLLLGKPHGLISYDQWSTIFENVFSRGASVDVADGFKHAWKTLATFKTPTNENFSDVNVMLDHNTLVQHNIYGRTATRIIGKNISQVPANPNGSLWALLTQTFQPTPELIELFPFWENGTWYLMYRMKTLPPLNKLDQLFEQDDQLVDDIVTSTQITADKSREYYKIERVIRYSLQFSSERNNYVEVTSPYVGASQLAGLVSQPVVLLDDVERYGLDVREISYPLLRDEAFRELLEPLSIYASALYSEGHAFANAIIDTMYQPTIKIGEWVRWYDYVDGGSVMTGYVNAVSHQLNIDERGTETKRTSITLERVSQYGRTSEKEVYG